MKTCKQRVSKAFGRMEPLEVRRLLSASVTSAIPTQNLTVGGSAPAVTLGSYFRDTLVPAGDSVVEVVTDLPAPNNVIPLVLTNGATPQTVANFLKYISSFEYEYVLIHRSIAGFVLQGGQFYPNGSSVGGLGAIPSEASTATLHNTAGTISAVLTSGPDSAEDGFFFNLADNNGANGHVNLNDTSDGGPFTTFGNVVYNGMSVLNTIAALPLKDDSSINSAWSQLPVLDGTGSFPSQPVLSHSTTGQGDQFTGRVQGTAETVATSELTSNLVLLNPQILPGGLTYTVTSQNSNVAFAIVVNGQLVLTAGSAAGSTKITIVATDLGGGTVTSSVVVKVAGAATSTGSLTPTLASSGAASALAGASLALKEKAALKAGASGFSGTTSAALLLSPTANAADSVATLGSASAKLNLKASQSKSLPLTMLKNVPGSVPVGSYHLLIQTIDSSGVTSTIDSGKTLSIGSAHVDLAGSFARVPASVKAGATTRFTFTITNSASATVAASGLLPIQIETSPDGLASDATVLVSLKKRINLKPGQRTTITVPVKLGAAGTPFVLVSLDPSKTTFTNDTNFSNNVFSSATTIKIV